MLPRRTGAERTHSIVLSVARRHHVRPLVAFAAVPTNSVVQLIARRSDVLASLTRTATCAHHILARRARRGLILPRLAFGCAVRALERRA